MKPSTVMLSFGIMASVNGAVPLCKTYNSTYDNINASPVTGVLSPLSTYNGLLYSAFSAASTSDALTGVKSQSPPNLVIATLRSDLISIGSLTLDPFGTISADRSAGTSAFALEQFSFGCALALAQGEADLPTSCVVTVTGFDGRGNQAPAQTFSYAPTDPTLAPMVTVQPVGAGYAALVNVTFAISVTGTGAPATTAFLLDNLITCNYS
ncbi:MAG: hypothetical protein M1821_002995 [Bathelium mastoideum]|nr:MAG: hypothetical protein M1821_002995 [Bathelium mastoideum]